MAKKRSKNAPKAQGCRGTKKSGKNKQPTLEGLQKREDRKGTGVILPGHKPKKTKKHKS